jgi:osmotically-inducible protein OsmY
MSISRKHILINCALLGAAAFGSVGFTGMAVAQQLNPPAPATSGVDQSADDRLRVRVKQALHSDPYFYDEHVTVTVEHGAVVLHGFVSSAWDLRDAIRIASKAAGDRRVIDKLSIELGGGR